MLPASFTPELLKRLELLKIHARRAYLGSKQGGHVSPKRGHGIEFSDYRRYELGDNPRHIDWGVYARSDRLFIKTFQEEQDISVLAIVDPTTSMRTPMGSGKWERACEIALAIAYVGLIEQDSASISVPGNWTSPFLFGPRAIHQLGRTLVDLIPQEPPDLRYAFQASLSHIRFPGVTVLISDLLMPFSEIEYIVNLMRAKNLDITVIQLLSDDDQTPLTEQEDIVAIDSETGEQLEMAFSTEQRAQYQFLLNQHTTAVRAFLTSAGINMLQTSSTQNLGTFLIEQLPQTGLLK